MQCSCIEIHCDHSKICSLRAEGKSDFEARSIVQLRQETQSPRDLHFLALWKVKEIKDWIHAKIIKVEQLERKFYGEEILPLVNF